MLLLPTKRNRHFCSYSTDFFETVCLTSQSCVVYINSLGATPSKGFGGFPFQASSRGNNEKPSVARRLEKENTKDPKLHDVL